MLAVEVSYLGAAPEEVEEAVHVRIEEAIQGIDGIKRIQTTASEGMGTMMIELYLGVDAPLVGSEVKSNIDRDHDVARIETEKPIIRELTNRGTGGRDDRAGVPRCGVRGSGAVDRGGRERGDGRGRVRGARQVQRRAAHGIGPPGRTVSIGVGTMIVTVGLVPVGAGRGSASWRRSRHR